MGRKREERERREEERERREKERERREEKERERREKERERREEKERERREEKERERERETSAEPKVRMPQAKFLSVSLYSSHAGQVAMVLNSDLGGTLSKFDVQSGHGDGGEVEEGGGEGGGEGWDGEGEWGGDWDVIGEGDNEERREQNETVEDTLSHKEENPTTKVKWFHDNVHDNSERQKQHNINPEAALSQRQI